MCSREGAVLSVKHIRTMAPLSVHTSAFRLLLEVRSSNNSYCCCGCGRDKHSPPSQRQFPHEAPSVVARHLLQRQREYQATEIHHHPLQLRCLRLVHASCQRSEVLRSLWWERASAAVIVSGCFLEAFEGSHPRPLPQLPQYESDGYCEADRNAAIATVPKTPRSIPSRNLSSALPIPSSLSSAVVA